MPEPFAVYPAHLGQYKNYHAQLHWDHQHLSQPLVIVEDVTQCRAYLVMGDDLSAICDTFDCHMDWPEHLVVWFDGEGQFRIYTCIACFRGGIEATPWFVGRLFDAPPARSGATAASHVPANWVAAIHEAITALSAGDDRHGHEIEQLEAVRAQLATEREVIIDIDSDGMLDCRVPAGVRVRVFDRSLEEPATFLYTADGAVERQPLIEPDEHAYVPEVGEWVNVYSKDAAALLPFVGRVVKVTDSLITVLDQQDDAWDVEPGEIESAESDSDESDDDDEGADVCDNCRRAGVAISQTCPCGKTLCADCIEEDDGLCGECAAEADAAASDEDESDDDQAAVAE